MNGLFFLTTELHRSFSSYITFTTLLQHSFRSVHHFYNTFASLLHHLYITFYIIPSAHTSLLRQFHPLCHLYIRPFLNVLKTVFGVGSENGKNRTLSRSSALTHSVEHVPVP